MPPDIRVVRIECGVLVQHLASRESSGEARLSRITNREREMLVPADVGIVVLRRDRRERYLAGRAIDVGPRRYGLGERPMPADVLGVVDRRDGRVVYWARRCERRAVASIRI